MRKQITCEIGMPGCNEKKKKYIYIYIYIVYALILGVLSIICMKIQSEIEKMKISFIAL